MARSGHLRLFGGDERRAVRHRQPPRRGATRPPRGQAPVPRRRSSRFGRRGIALFVRFALAPLLAAVRHAAMDSSSPARRPVEHLLRHAAINPAGPHQRERREQLPGAVGLDDAARHDLAAHRGGVEPAIAEARQEPQAGRDLADLRHPMHGVAEEPGPGIFGLDVLELREGAPDLAEQRLDVILRLAAPHRAAARPHQPVALHDAVVVVGEIGVAHRAGEAHRLVQRRHRAAR